MSEAFMLRVNGEERQVADAWLGESLLYVLRERLGLPGAKSGCEQGECGSCSVIIDGSLQCACLVLAAAATGTEIVTVEGLQSSEHTDLTALQQAFITEGAVQCGFCTPGLIVAVHDLLAGNPSPTDLEVREAISGNLCRCTGYGRIFAAIDTAKSGRASAPAGPGVGAGIGVGGGVGVGGGYPEEAVAGTGTVDGSAGGVPAVPDGIG